MGVTVTVSKLTVPSPVTVLTDVLGVGVVLVVVLLSVLLSELVDVELPAAVPEGAMSKAMYPNKSWDPQVSGNQPGHGSWHSSVSTWDDLTGT